LEFVKLFVEHVAKTTPQTKKEIVNKLSRSSLTPLVIALQFSPKAAEHLLDNDADAQLENVRDVWGNVSQVVQQPISVAAQHVRDPYLMEKLCSKSLDLDYIYNHSTALDVMLTRLDSVGRDLGGNLKKILDSNQVVLTNTHNIQNGDAFTKWVEEQLKKVFKKKKKKEREREKERKRREENKATL